MGMKKSAAKRMMSSAPARETWPPAYCVAAMITPTAAPAGGGTAPEVSYHTEQDGTEDEETPDPDDKQDDKDEDEDEDDLAKARAARKRLGRWGG